MIKRNSEYKPLSFTTTLRNPERIKKFLNVLIEFEGKILTNKLIENIVFKIISQKIYIPIYVNSNQQLKNQLKLESNFDKSDTIPAHLYKDGLRHIHPDSSQCRTITVREAARLQTFSEIMNLLEAKWRNIKWYWML